MMRVNACSQACMCADRWVAPIDLEQGAGTGSAAQEAEQLAQLRVHRPADLAWVDLACQACMLLELPVIRFMLLGHSSIQ